MVGAMRPPLSIAARKQAASSEFDISGDDKLPKSRSPMLLRMSSGLRWTPSRQWPRRIVYVGVGDGHPSELREQALADARAKGILIVRSARVGNGIVARNNEVNDDKRVSSFSDTLNPQNALILLTVALTKTKDTREIQSIFTSTDR